MDKITAKIRREFSVPDNHTFVGTTSQWVGAKKGQDIDKYTYDQIDDNGKVCASYSVEDATSTYPPHSRTISISKL